MCRLRCCRSSTSHPRASTSAPVPSRSLLPHGSPTRPGWRTRPRCTCPPTGPVKVSGPWMMTRISGTVTDGIYRGTITVPTTAASGTWTVMIDPLYDTLGNSESDYHEHPQKLTVTSRPGDVSAPVLSQFDFTPKSVDVSAGSKSVTVTARVTDATGVAYPPSVYLSSDRTSQSLGSVDDDPNLGNGHRWDLPGHHHRAHHRCVRDMDRDDRPAVDTLGNSESDYHEHPQKLVVSATRALSPAPTPKITGTAKVGYTLKATPGTWGPAPVALKYQWKVNGAAISGATASHLQDHRRCSRETHHRHRHRNESRLHHGRQDQRRHRHRGRRNTVTGADPEGHRHGQGRLHAPGDGRARGDRPRSPLSTSGGSTAPPSAAPPPPPTRSPPVPAANASPSPSPERKPATRRPPRPAPPLPP